MLNRVSAALVKFIAPISAPSAAVAQKRESSQFQKDPKQESKKSPLKLVESPPEEKAAAPVVPPNANAVTGTLLQLLAILHVSRARFLSLFGKKTYPRVVREQDQSKRFGKGAMLDHKAE